MMIIFMISNNIILEKYWVVSVRTLFSGVRRETGGSLEVGYQWYHMAALICTQLHYHPQPSHQKIVQFYSSINYHLLGRKDDIFLENPTRLLAKVLATSNYLRDICLVTTDYLGINFKFLCFHEVGRCVHQTFLVLHLKFCKKFLWRR